MSGRRVSRLTGGCLLLASAGFLVGGCAASSRNPPVDSGSPCTSGCDAGGTCSSSAGCGVGYFCAASTCGGSGICAGRPQACPADCAVPELCGCDGQLYCNECLANSAGTTVSAGGSACGQGDAGGGLSWYATCGYPVCSSSSTDGGVVLPDGGPCPALGSRCASVGSTCGAASAANCGVTEVCSLSDPKVGGCPISSRSYKQAIEYLDGPALQELHDRVVQTRLATYRYRSPYGDPEPNHLGFIIEDQPRSPAVDAARGGIDLYAYLSMVVATTQVQEAEIRALRSELAEARKSGCLSGRPR